MPVAVTLAAEGLIDFAVLRRLVRDVGLEPGHEHGGAGKGRLDNRIVGYNDAAQFAPWLVARDLDHDAQCPAALARRLVPHPSTLMRLRIVVRSVEAWLMADTAGLAGTFGIASESQVPPQPEALDDPKATLLGLLARSSRRDIRTAMVRYGAGGRLMIGPEYNTLFECFVAVASNPDAASSRADSLGRARRRLLEFAVSLSAGTPRRRR
ncbi:MAG: hypothetical protein FJX67_04965 [Alphaproteobacteria bacterium]|nr:hypothetical protein [Alphaproteobacteria bacterium]